MKNNLTKLTVLLATAAAGFAFAGAAQAQPRPDEHPRMEAPHRAPPRHKVWVPAHRDHGHMVRGHFIYR